MSSHDADTPAERATRVARVRSEIDAGIWVVIWLSLAFTAINVQIFAARGAEIWTLAWCAAWLLDPMVSILVLVVVRAEQITSRWQVQLGWPITATKWGCFAATYAMNTWSSWAEQSPSMIVLHSVPPAMMLLAAEVGPRIRDGLTRAVLAASARLTGAEGAGGDLAAGRWPAPPVPLPYDVAPDGARGPDPVVPQVGSGPGRVPDPAAVEVEPPTTRTAAGSGPDRIDPGQTSAEPGSDRRGLSGSSWRLCESAPDRVLLPAPSEAFTSGPCVDLTTSGSAPDTERHTVPDAYARDALSPPDVDRPGDGPADPRVRLLRELLDGNCPVTGAQAATLLTHAHGSTSDRTGRRLLAEARHTRPVDAELDHHDPSTDTTDRDERARTGTDGGPAPSPLSLVPRPTPPSPGVPS